MAHRNEHHKEASCYAETCSHWHVFNRIAVPCPFFLRHPFTAGMLFLVLCISFMPAAESAESAEPTMSGIAPEIATIRVHGKTIAVGDFADDVLKIVKKEDKATQEIQPDPEKEGALIVAEHYKVDGASFTIMLAREKSQGRYIVKKIATDNPKALSAVMGLSVGKFESSVFFKEYKLSGKERAPIKAGGMAYSYRFEDEENPAHDFIVVLSPNPSNVREVLISWKNHKNSRKELSDHKAEVVKVMLESTYDDAKTDAVLAYLHKQKWKAYPKGRDTMPRTRVNTIGVYFGMVGDTAIVGFER